MISFTDSLLKSDFKQYWLAGALLAVFILLMILMVGSTKHSTLRLESAPVVRLAAPSWSSAEMPAERISFANRQELLSHSASLAPYLNVVPSQDGTALYISVGGVGTLDGTVFANVGVGPGHHKGGYTMTYSDTVQSYVTTATGFTPNSGASGPVSITTTLGLDSGAVNFNRAFIPASTAQTVSSIDGNLQLSLVNPKTIDYDTYIAVVPSYGLPGPLPAGHRLVSSAFSIRAAGALLVTPEPMSLRLYYDDAALAGADPHTLAIFAWDAFHKRWDDLGGTLFSIQQYLSVPTSRFTTYALMSTPAWRDSFDEFSGLDFSQFSNVTLGGTPGDRTLTLANTPGSGSAVTLPITPSADFIGWGGLRFTGVATPPTTNLSVDILRVDGNTVLANVGSGTNLADLSAAQYPALRLRVNLASTTAGQTPALADWQLSWQSIENQWVYLPMILK